MRVCVRVRERKREEERERDSANYLSDICNKTVSPSQC